MHLRDVSGIKVTSHKGRTLCDSGGRDHPEGAALWSDKVDEGLARLREEARGVTGCESRASSEGDENASG